MQIPPVPRWLIPRLPFFYGWVILACACCAGLARQGGANATLSVFVAPMTGAFGWSRTGISGAVALGGVLAVLATPVLGRFVDRAGARLLLCLAVLTTGLANLGLALTASLTMFYLLFCIARINFAGPFDLGIYGAVNNWFVARRGVANAIATVGQMAGLVLLPMIAALGISLGGWREGWVLVGLTVLAAGFVPVFFLMVRAPEDAGLLPDGREPIASASRGAASPEPRFTRRQALRTRGFWAVAGFTALAYPVQAGVSLHQAPFLIERGLTPAVAASVVSFFSLMSGVASFGLGVLPRRIPIRLKLAASGVLMAAGTLLYGQVHGAMDAYLAAAGFGMGVGGILVLSPIAWAEYFGRQSYGAIRGVALTVQVSAQAAGPLLSGLLRDASGAYDWSLFCFTVLAGGSVVAGLLAAPPAAPKPG